MPSLPSTAERIHHRYTIAQGRRQQILDALNTNIEDGRIVPMKARDIREKLDPYIAQIHHILVGMEELGEVSRTSSGYLPLKDTTAEPVGVLKIGRDTPKKRKGTRGTVPRERIIPQMSDPVPPGCVRSVIHVCSQTESKPTEPRSRRNTRHDASGASLSSVYW
jgi:hypothetical protein